MFIKLIKSWLMTNFTVRSMHPASLIRTKQIEIAVQPSYLDTKHENCFEITTAIVLDISIQICQKKVFRCQHSDQCNNINELVVLGILAIDGQHKIRINILDTKHKAFFSLFTNVLFQ